MAETIMNMFKLMIIVQLFWAFSITTLTHSSVLPADATLRATDFIGSIDTVDTTAVADDVEDALSRQTNVPLIDVGALVFYSTNIIIDLLLNFLFAIPQMFFFLFNGVATIFSVPFYIQYQLQAIAFAAILIMYIIGLVQLLTGLRAGRVIS